MFIIVKSKILIKMKKITDYKTLIFDFGGVILNINKELTYSAFIQIFGKEAVTQIMKSRLIENYEKGEITTDDFFYAICTWNKKKVERPLLEKAWNAMLLNYEATRINKIKELKNTHRLILLSNTNECHYHFYENKLLKEFGMHLKDIFSSVYLSYQLKLWKPDIAIYQKILEAEGIIAEETLFIEDTLVNAKAAEKIGINTLVIVENDDFYKYF